MLLEISNSTQNRPLCYDYHFMVQTSTGQWAEKHGSLGSTYRWDVGLTPDDVSWSLPGVSDSYYDSPILYYAIGQ